MFFPIESNIHIKTMNFGKRLSRSAATEVIQRLHCSTSEICRRSNADILRELRYDSIKIVGSLAIWVSNAVAGQTELGCGRLEHRVQNINKKSRACSERKRTL